MSPYYQDESATLYHGDCLALDDWAAGDVMLTDPPYGIAYRSNYRRDTLARSIIGDDDTSLRDAVLATWAPRPALVFGSWRKPRPADTRALLIWDTKGALGMGAMDLPWKPSHQEVYVLGKGFAGPRSTDVLTCPPVQAAANKGRVHPHEKPTPLLAALIRKCPPGVVVDPFAGSGSTLVAAKQEGRRAIGVEVDERYCEVAAKRLQQGVLDFGASA